MIHRLQRLPIRNKLLLILLATSFFALGLAGTAFLLHLRAQARQSMVEDLQALARILGDRSSAALLFDDARAAEENLQSLRAKPSIEAASIHHSDGSMFARFGKAPHHLENAPQLRIEARRIVIVEGILHEGQIIGHVRIEANQRALEALLKQNLLSGTVILFFAGLGAFILSTLLQRWISGPLIQLTQVARRVAHERDFSVRAEAKSEDEVGELVQAFNTMLSRLDEQNQELVRINKEQEEMLRALQDSITRFRALFEQAAVGAALVEAQTGKILLVNQRYCDILGYDQEELAGKRFWDLAEPCDRIVEADWMVALLEDRIREFTLDKRYQTKNRGLVWTTTTVSALWSPGEAPSTCISIAQDISDRKQWEEEIRRLNLDLERRVAERTEELRASEVELRRMLEVAESADRLKSAFLATMSHELRTPLNSIIGFTGILLQGLGGPLTQEQAKQLGMVKDSASHLLNLINDVLDISKIESGQLKIFPEDFQLPDLVERVARSTGPLAERKGIQLRLDLDPGLGTINSDRRRVEQVLLNLLSNAIKFTEEGGVLIQVLPMKGQILFRVQDSGIGIAPEDLPNLFKPFSQVDSGLTRKYEGTGLGLSICKKLVELMGGNIQVESRPGQGSTFSFTLPLASSAHDDSNVGRART